MLGQQILAVALAKLGRHGEDAVDDDDAHRERLVVDGDLRIAEFTAVNSVGSDTPSINSIPLTCLSVRKGAPGSPEATAARMSAPSIASSSSSGDHPRTCPRRTSSRKAAPQLPRNRRWRATQGCSNLPARDALGTKLGNCR